MQQKDGGGARRSWQKNLLSLLLVGSVGLAGALAGCGGGGSSSSGGAGGATVSTLSGVVADGYLVGVTVCADLNENNQCDSGEPVATTDADGAYTLEGTDIESYPVVVVVPAGTPDGEGGTFDKPLILSSPPGTESAKFISPVSTMVHQQMKANGLSAEQAQAVVKKRLGVAESTPVLGEAADFIKHKAANQDLEVVHKVARVAAKAFGELHSQFETTLGGSLSDEQVSAIVTVVVDKVMQELSGVVQQIADLETNEQVDSLAGSVASNVAGENSDASSLTDELAAAALPKEDSAFDALLNAGGSYWLGAWDYMDENGQMVQEAEYGRVYLDASGALQEEQYRLNPAGGWDLDVSQDDDYQLVDGQWVLAPEGPDNYAIQFNNDGSALLTHRITGAQERITATEVAIAGKPMGQFAKRFHRLLADPTAPFGPGAKAFKLAFENLVDTYEVSLWLDDQGQDRNFVAIWTGPETFTKVTSLQQMLESFPAGGNDYLQVGSNLVIQFGPNNSVLVFRQMWSMGMMGPSYEQIAGGSYLRSSATGVDMVQLDLPEFVKYEGEFDGLPCFVVWANGDVKVGEFSPAGMVDFGEDFEVNEVAFQDIMENFVAPGTDTGSDTPSLLDPPAEAEVVPFSPGELSGNTFALFQPDQVTLLTFNSDGSISEATREDSAPTPEIRTDSGTWSVDLDGVLNLQFASTAPKALTLEKLADSTTETLSIYFEEGVDGVVSDNGYLPLEVTLPFADMNGVTLVGEDGDTLAFGAGTGILTEDGEAIPFDFTQVDGVLTLFMGSDEITVHQLAESLVPGTITIVGTVRESGGAIVDVFNDVMSVQ
ncbi:hypothetical protein DESUT3_05630 [Desulfuromonas versatilis]|uniref:Carboxypeptidase regulatory-like domain-containing protein n=1 Tax=Desulfuromonas versatilis TaxID=2802975 RepID=A0ABN6DUE3_9BACT|nr:hypothetical protein [Desulfuromonas versatilis]BCR03494.1 hypothetical protein DESUT3_05630 [Desulfuromonas versatilis]